MSTLPIVPYPEPFPNRAGLVGADANIKDIAGLSFRVKTSPAHGIPLHVEHHGEWWCGACGAPLTQHPWPCRREMDLRTARLKELA